MLCISHDQWYWRKSFVSQVLIIYKRVVCQFINRRLILIRRDKTHTTRLYTEKQRLWCHKLWSISGSSKEDISRYQDRPSHNFDPTPTHPPAQSWVISGLPSRYLWLLYNVWNPIVKANLLLGHGRTLQRTLCHDRSHTWRWTGE